MTDFKYDVAFSFVSDDETTAKAIEQRISGRLQTFIYLNRQEQLAGTDGLESFSDVFGYDARTVVIVLGKGWGESPWTRAEKTAIGERLLREGPEFMLVIVVREGATCIPPFIPRTRLYFDFDHWGIDGACATIEAHVRRQGGEPTPVTFEKEAIRRHSELEAESKRQAFIHSNHATRWGAEQMNELESLIRAVSANSPIRIDVRPGNNMVSVAGPGSNMSAVWTVRLREGPEMVVTYYDTRSDAGGSGTACPILKKRRFKVDLCPSGDPGWREKEACIGTAAVVDEILRNLLEFVR